MKAWESKRDFKEVIMEDAELLKHLDVSELDAAFDMGYALRWVDAIFERVFS